MKNTRLLRILSLFGFLLLMAPFYDTCSDNYSPSKVEPSSKAVEEKKVEEKVPFREKVYDVVVDEYSLHGFQLAYLNTDYSFKGIKDEIIKVYQDKKWYSNLFIYVSFIFDFIIIISFSMFVLSFTKKIKTLNKLALVNSILIISTLLYFIFLENSFEYFPQIKWGYYAFILTNILGFYFSRKTIKDTSK